MKIIAIMGRILYVLLAKHLPSSSYSALMGKIRVMLARCFAVGIDKRASIEREAVFSSKVVVKEKGNIGINAYIQGKVIIGKYVMMGPECSIWTINHETERTDIPMCEQGTRTEQAVIIEDDVWIGAKVTILPGVHIGRGSIIGAGSVVSKDIPEYSVAVGNPVRVIKNRRYDSVASTVNQDWL